MGQWLKTLVDVDVAAKLCSHGHESELIALEHIRAGHDVILAVFLPICLRSVGEERADKCIIFD